MPLRLGRGRAREEARTSRTTSGTDPSVPGLFGQVNDLARHTGWLPAPTLSYAAYGLVLFAGMLLAVAASQPLVRGVREARPYTDHPRILVLAHRSADFSFPSDHAVLAGAVAAGLWLVSKRLGVLATVAALVMGFARVHIAAHYPHDVIAGLAFGAVIVLGGWLVLCRPLTWLVEWLTRTPVRPLLLAGAVVPADARADRTRRRRVPV